MQPVSTTYCPYPDEGKAAIRVKFGLVDVAAAGDTRPEASEENAVSQTVQVIREAEGMGGKWATLERDHFRLDGSFQLFPDVPAEHHVGWWSAQQSDETGALSPAPTMTFHFTKPHTSIGFTVIFDDLADQYCTDFTIEAYGASGALLTRADVTGNTLANCPVTLNTDNYTKVVFIFQKTNKPLRFVRVAQILFGIVQKQENYNTESATLLYEINPSMSSAPANEFTITIDNADHRYNMVNPNGLYRFLQQGQALDVELGVGARGAVEYVDMGRFYFTRSKASDSSLTAQITADNPFSAMDKTTYRKGRRGTAKAIDFIRELFTDAGFPLSVISDGDIGARLVDTSCEVMSHRRAVQLAAQAARCICVVTRANEVRLMEPAIHAPTDTVTLDQMTDMPVVDIADRINTIELKTPRLTTGENGADTIHESTVAVNGTATRWFDYKSLAYGVTASVSGGALVTAEYYIGAALLTLTGNGAVTVKLTGTPYNRTDATCTAQNLQAGENEQAEKLDNPLVAEGSEQAVADWLLSLKRDAYTYSVSDRANPAREAGDSVRIYDAYGEHRAALVTKLQIKFDGGLSETMEAMGGTAGG